jgi:aspartyl-tRNA(Asn)/glutamyl-tRNA(Gln) amidotransferase subunit A
MTKPVGGEMPTDQEAQQKEDLAAARWPPHGPAGSSRLMAIAAQVATGEVSATALIADALARAAAEPGMVWSLDSERATADAALVEQRVAAGEHLGPLGGVPVLVKDSFDVAGQPTSGGLPWTLHVGVDDAPAVAALRRAGAIVIGKTAMDQLGWSMDGEAPGHPACASPAAPGRRAGGSSAGSAAAVGAGLVPLALGTDSAGSTRVPAAWCRIVGLQVSPGASDMRGCLPTVPGIDSLGLLADSAADCRHALDAITGGRLPARRDMGAVRLGVLTDCFEEVGDPVVHAALDAALARLRSAGIGTIPLVGSVTAPGLGAIFARRFSDAWIGRLEGTLQPAVREGIERGAAIGAERLAKAQTSLASAAQEAGRLLDGLDGLLLPTTPLLPPPLGTETPLAEVSVFTRAFPAFGWAAISIPCGAAGGPPVGVQLACPPGADALLLDLAEQIEPIVRAETDQ